MDIKKLQPQVTKLEILNPADDSPTGVVFSLIGQDTKQFRDLDRKSDKQMVLKAMRGECTPAEMEKLEKQDAELAAVCIVGWTGLEENGVELQYSPAKATELMANPEFALIKKQIVDFIGERKNFFRPAGKPA